MKRYDFRLKTASRDVYGFKVRLYMFGDSHDLQSIKRAFSKATAIFPDWTFSLENLRGQGTALVARVWAPRPNPTESPAGIEIASKLAKAGVTLR